MLVGFPTLEHATYSCPYEKHGSQCCHTVCETFPRKEETGWGGRRRYINIGASDTRARDCQGWQHCVVIPLAKRLTERRERLRRWKNVLSVDREQKKDGQRLDRLYVIICINAMQMQVQFISHFHPISSGFHFHTHAFRSLLRVFIARPTVCDVTPARGYNTVAVQCGAGSHLLCKNRHPLATKLVEKVGKVKYCGPIHTLRSLPHRGGDVCKVSFRSVQKCGFV